MPQKSDFCSVHPNLFARTHCENCSNGMCITCSGGTHTICPSCRKPQQKKKKTTVSTSDQKIVKQGAIIGCIGILLIFIGYLISPKIDSRTFLFGILFLFAIGSGATYLHYWVIKYSFFQKVKKIPFFGRKIYFIFLLFISSYFTFILFPLYCRKAYLTYLK